ncbi:MAG: phosphoribosyltransferase family protein [Candidatus Woesearchaeota archaeon]
MSEPQSKLLLVAGTGDSTKLAKHILEILSETYGMGNSVQMHKPLRSEQVQKSMRKAHPYPLVLDAYPDDETRVDMGKNLLLDEFRGKHVAIVKYMYTPRRRPNMSINDHIYEIRGLLDVLDNTDILHRTLVVPYMPYLRSHSVDKYKKKGFYQFDSLERMVKDFNEGNVNSIICIDPHSEKLEEIASKYGMNTYMVNPFKSSEMINPAKLGLNGEDSDAVLRTLQPFIEHYRKVKEDDGKISFISPDSNAERRVENFLVDSRRSVDPLLSWSIIGYRGKDRETMSNPTGMFKSFSQVNEGNIDPDTTYVIIDDMLSSGGTAEEVAKMLKQHGARRVELWCSHPIAPEREKVVALKYLDKIVVLDTVLHDNPDEMHLQYIESSAELLAAELYKVHMRLENERVGL